MGSRQKDGHSLQRVMQYDQTRLDSGRQTTLIVVWFERDSCPTIRHLLSLRWCCCFSSSWHSIILLLITYFSEFHSSVKLLYCMDRVHSKDRSLFTDHTWFRRFSSTAQIYGFINKHTPIFCEDQRTWNLTPICLSKLKKTIVFERHIERHLVSIPVTLRQQQEKQNWTNLEDVFVGGVISRILLNERIKYFASLAHD